MTNKFWCWKTIQIILLFLPNRKNADTLIEVFKDFMKMSKFFIIYDCYAIFTCLLLLPDKILLRWVVEAQT